MGAKAGVGDYLDNNFSPRFAAIEEAQAELRQEVAVREERRRELDFLEKGGNPLDFQVGEVLNLFGSSTDPLADQLLPINSGGLNGCRAGGVVENNWACDITQQNATDAANNQNVWTVSKLVSSGGSIDQDVKVCSSSNICCDVVGNETEFSSLKGKEPVRRTCSGGRGQSYIRRNRHRVKWDGLGDPNGIGGIEDLPEKHDCAKVSSGFVTSGSLSSEDILLVDARCQTPLIAYVDCGSPKCDVINAGACFPSNAGVPGGKADQISVALLPDTSTKSWTDLLETGADLDVDKKNISFPAPDAGKDAYRSVVLANPLSQADSVPSPWQPTSTWGKYDAQSNLCEAYLAQRTCGRAEAPIHCKKCTCEGEVIGAATSDEVPKVSNCQITCGLIRVNDDNCQMETDPYVLLGRELSAAAFSSSNCVRGKPGTASTRNTFLLAAKSEVMFGPNHPRSKCESHMLPFASEMPDVESNSSELKDEGCPQPPSPGHEGRREIQPAEPVFLTSLSSPHPRAALSAGPSVNRFPGVILPWEKEQNPLAIAEAERRKANISAAAKKAQEDCILEEAETIMASRLHIAVLDRQRPLYEPRKKKSHWDFVVEEMVWMANDFMQERLWKNAAAASFVHSVAVTKSRHSAQKINAVLTERLVAHKLVNAVLKFWQIVTESFLRGENDGSSISLHSNGPAPMEVDVLELKKGPGCEGGRPVQDYCFRNVKEFMSREFGAQVEAPATPDRTVEQPLVYTRSEVAFGMYHGSVTTHWSLIEAEHEQARHPATSVAEIEGDDKVTGDELLSSDLTPEAGYMLHLSSPRKGFSDEEVHSHSLGGNVHDSGTMASIIAKKKRKKIVKAIPLKFAENITGSGTSFDRCLGSSASVGYICPSVSTGKRSSPGGSLSSVISVGSIPIKRLRTSAVAARQRAAGMGAVSVSSGIGGVLARGSSAHLSQLQPQQESVLASSPGNIPVNGVSGPSVVQSVRSNLLFCKSKKKKKKHFSGALRKGSMGDGGAVQFSNSCLKRENLKRKADPCLLPGSSTQSSEAGSDEFDVPGSPGAANKKSKLLKQPPDGNPDAAPSAGVAALQAAAQLPNVSSKLARQNSSRDRSSKKSKPSKVSSTQSGLGIPWSAAEDQAMLHLVQNLGPNWELVSDVLRFNAQLKGICRKPKHCREHHRALVDHVSGEGCESPNAFTSVHPSCAAGPMKGLVEDLEKLHFEHIVHLVQKHNLSKPKSVGYGQMQLVQSHPSHAIIMSQYCTSGISGVYCTPLELCDRSSTGEVTAQQYQMQPQFVGGVGLPSVSSGSPSLRPGSAGMPAAVQASPPLTPSSVAGHSQTVREGQRLAQMRPFLQEEVNQMRLARAAAIQRGLQQSVTPVTAGLPVLSPSDCGGPSLLTGSSSTIVAGLKRGMSVPRAGVPGPSSSIASASLGSMLLPGGVGMSTGGPSPGSGVPAQMNVIRRPRDLAQLRGNAQAAAALSSFNNSFSSNLISSQPQAFAPQQQLQPPQVPAIPQQSMQSNQLPHPQQQTNAYYAAQERQMQQQQQAQRILQQQHIRQQSNPAQMQQLSPSGAQQQQHAQGHVHPQHSHGLILHQQVGSQRKLSMQSQQLLLPPSLPTSSGQQPSPPPTTITVPPKPGASTVSHGQQVVSAAEANDQSRLLYEKMSPVKQVQKHQQVQLQVQSRVLKSSGHGGSTMQDLTPLPASSTGIPGHLTPVNRAPSQRQSLQGPRSLHTQASKQSGKQMNQVFNQIPLNRFAGKQGQGIVSIQDHTQGATQGLISTIQHKQVQQFSQSQGSGSTPSHNQPVQKYAHLPVAAVAGTSAKAAAAIQSHMPTSPTASAPAPSVTSPSSGTSQLPAEQLANSQTLATAEHVQVQPQNAQMQTPPQRRQHQQPGYRKIPLLCTSIGGLMTSAGVLSQELQASTLLQQQSSELVGSGHGNACGRGETGNFGSTSVAAAQPHAQPNGGLRLVEDLQPLKAVGFDSARVVSLTDVQLSNSSLGAEGAYPGQVVSRLSQGGLGSWTDQTTPNLLYDVQTPQIHANVPGTSGAVAQRSTVKASFGDIASPCASGAGSSPPRVGSSPRN